MALVAVASAKGAPGVTTLTVALGALTADAIVADLDPDGGDLALRYGGQDGSPLDPEIGLLSLAASLRRDHSGETGPVDQHLQVASGGLDLLLGVTSQDQAVGLGPLWSPLARALAESNRTVFADCGRVGPASPAMPALMQADAVLLLARAELEELAHLRERLRFLTTTLPGRYAGPARIGVILVARERDRAAGPRTEQLLRASGLAIPVLGTIADDPRGADRLRGHHGGRAGRSTLVRSVRSLMPAVQALIGPTLRVGVLTEAARANTSQAVAPPPPTPPVPDAVTAQANGRGSRGRKHLGPPVPPPPPPPEPLSPYRPMPPIAAVQTRPAQPQPVQPEPVQPETVQPETVQPATVQPELDQIQDGQIEHSQIEDGQIEHSQITEEQIQDESIQDEQVEPAQQQSETAEPVRLEKQHAGPGPDEDPSLEDQLIEDEPATGWPKPGRGNENNEAPNGSPATVLQNWGR